MCDIYIRSWAFSYRTRLRPANLPRASRWKIFYLNIAPELRTRSLYSAFAYPASETSIISYFHLSRHILFSIGTFAIYEFSGYVLVPSSPRTGLCFPIPPTEMRYHIRIVAPIVPPAGRPTDIDFRSKNSPRCPTNISYGFASQKIPSPMLSLVGARSYHPLAFDFNTTASAMNFYNRALPPRGCTVRKRAPGEIRLSETISGGNVSTWLILVLEIPRHFGNIYRFRLCFK